MTEGQGYRKLLRLSEDSLHLQLHPDPRPRAGLSQSSAPLSVFASFIQSKIIVSNITRTRYITLVASSIPKRML